MAMNWQWTFFNPNLYSIGDDRFSLRSPWKPDGPPNIPPPPVSPPPPPQRHKQLRTPFLMRLLVYGLSILQAPDCCITIRTILCWTFLRIFAFIFISLRAGRNAISDHIRQKLSKDKQAVKYPTLTRSKKSKGRSMNATGDFITNKRAVFMQPHRRLPSHFEIHPEFESESRFINHFGTEKISWNIPLLVSNEQHCIILRSPALMTLFMRLIRYKTFCCRSFVSFYFVFAIFFD